MFRFDPKELSEAAGRSFVHSRVVRFQDVDAAGIVFYPRVLEYFHDAYVALLDDAGCSLPKVLEAGEWAAPIRHAEAHFFRPMRFGDEIDVKVCRAHLEPSTATFGFKIAKRGADAALAVGHSRHVWVDRASFSKIEIPAALSEAFARLGG